MYGSFDDKAKAAWDFARCQRPDGSIYGSRGRCRQGKEIGAKEKEAPKPKRAKKEAAPSAPKEVTDEDIRAAQDEYSRVSNQWADLIWSKKKEEADKLAPEKMVAWERLKELERRKAEQDAKKAESAPKEKSGKVNAKNFDSSKAQEEAEKRQAKYDAAQSKVKLNEKQADALYIYSSDDATVPGKFAYQQLNKCARDPANCSDPKKAKELTKNLDSALAALPKNTNGDPFFRGIDTRDSPAAAKLFEVLAKSKPGDVISDPAFGSYSSNPAVARDFATSGSKSIVFVSRNKGLTPMNTYAIIPEQNEALLPRGTEQTIRKVTRKGDTLVVEVD